jgi:hypothetical protein
MTGMHRTATTMRNFCKPSWPEYSSLQGFSLADDLRKNMLINSVDWKKKNVFIYQILEAFENYYKTVSNF